MPRQPFASTPEQIEQAKILRGEGMTLARVAELFDVSPGTIRYWTAPGVREKAKADWPAAHAKNTESRREYAAQYYQLVTKKKARARSDGNDA